MNFVYEILAVGVSTAIIGFIISTMLMYVFVKDFSNKKYNFWWQVMLSYFITGCLVHILCQVTGVNKWYCKNGVACK
jgi:O-antigen/teichoic acid export membrane protein